MPDLSGRSGRISYGRPRLGWPKARPVGELMRELRFDGLSEDGSKLILAGKDGQRWSLVIDERIEAAVRRDRARLGQVEIEQSGELRPREIQARIRAGATAEDVAAASGLPIERIRRFEGPVLTERAYMAIQAGQIPLRSNVGSTVAEVVLARLADQGVDSLDVSWDAWRRDDGLWTVIVTFPLGVNRHVASWVYDPPARSMVPADDNAETLIAPSAPAAGLRLVPSRGPQPNLVAVAAPPTPADDVASAQLTAVDEDDEEEAAELAEAEAEAADQAAEEQAAEEEVTEEDVTTPEPSGKAAEDQEDEAGSEVEIDPGPALFDATEEPLVVKTAVGKPPVPSFDDILFGPGPKR